MNIMMKIGDEVVTPPLNDAILASITRDSRLTRLRDLGNARVRAPDPHGWSRLLGNRIGG